MAIKQTDLFNNLQDYLPGFSVDCVIFTYHNRRIKVLLNKIDTKDQWLLPGGFVKRDEDVDDSAYRILRERTGLDEIYLQQFHLFGKVSRTSMDENLEILKLGEQKSKDVYHYLMNRFVSVGYFALVNYDKVIISERDSDIYDWFELDNIPKLYSDHNQIINKAINVVRLLIDHLPLGYQLLPEKFILPDLRAIYECILGKELDKRNFQKKMISSGLIIQLDERKVVNTYPHPYYYIFNKEKIKDLIFI